VERLVGDRIPILIEGPVLGIGLRRNSSRLRVVAALVFSWLLAGLPVIQSACAAELLSVDLGASSRDVVANRSAQITVAGRTQRVLAGDVLTPAEQIAVNQILNSGRQNIILGAQGTATGGFVNLTRDVHLADSANLAALAIPKGVTVVKDFGYSSALNLAGNFSNAGQFYAYSTNAMANVATINATNIINLQGGLISSILPTTGIPGVLTALAALNLNLRAVNAVTNLGMISSSGSLTVNGGSSISNGGAIPPTPDLGYGQASMQAVQDVHLFTGALSNTGLISSLTSNINIHGLNGTNLSIANRGGTLEASKGAVNILNQYSSYDGIIDIFGGNLNSQFVNIDAGKGWIKANVQQVPGIVNLTAGNTCFGASTPNLRFGTLNVTDDPTYFNTNGSLIMLGGVPASNGANLALIASGDIIIGSGSIDTTKTSGGDAGDFLAIAGASVSSNGSSSASGDTSTQLSITQSGLTAHGSATGGAISFVGISAISSNGVQTGDGGNVTLIAFGGSGAGNGLVPGTIDLGDTASINTYGSSGRTNGNVLVIAGATVDPAGGAAVKIPAIFTGRSQDFTKLGGTSGGSVSIFTATPQVTTFTVTDGTPSSSSAISASIATLGTTINLSAVGSPVQQSSIVGGLSLPASIISDGGSSSVPMSIVTSGADINLRGGTISAAGFISADGQSATTPSSTFYRGKNGGNITIQAASNIDLYSLQSSGGRGGRQPSTDRASAGGNGGTISVVAGGDLTILPGAPCDPCFSVAAVGGAGGQAAGLVSGLDGPGMSGGAGGNGGSVTLQATNGSIYLTAVEVAGGGGSGGNGAGRDPSGTNYGVAGGEGGNGGDGGNITISAQHIIDIQYFVDGSGGGGGGAGASGVTFGGGGGGGGGSLGWAGSGGGAGRGTLVGTVYAAGGGGGGGGIIGLGGQSDPANGPGVHDGKDGSICCNRTPHGGAGGVIIGSWGEAGDGFDGFGAGAGGQAGSGGTGAFLYRPNGQSTFTSAGRFGFGGHVTVSSENLIVSGSVDSFWGQPALFGTNSMIALGPEGTINISTDRPGVNPQYAQNGDLTSTVRNVPFRFGLSSVAVSTGTAGYGLFGGLRAGTSDNIIEQITINGQELFSPIVETTYFFAGAGTGSQTITVGGVDVTYDQNSLVTPAELIALIQNKTGVGQSLTIAANGSVLSGSFSIGPQNAPNVGFSNLLIPSGISVSADLKTLRVLGDTTIDGLLNFTSGGASLTTSTLTVSGTLSSDTNALIVYGTVSGNNQPSSLAFTLGNVASIPSTLTISANTLSLVSAGPSFGSQVQPIKTNAENVTASTAGSVFISNTVLDSLKSLKMGAFTAAGTVSVINNSNLISDANITCADLTLRSLEGTISQGIASAIAANSLDLRSDAGAITLGLGAGQTSGVLSVSALSFHSTSGNVLLKNTAALSLDSSITGGTFTLTNILPLTVNGTVSFAAAAVTTQEITNNGFMMTTSSPTGTILFQSPALSNLVIDGSGQWNAQSGVAFFSANGYVRFSGDQTIDGAGGHSISAPVNAVVIDPGVTLTVNSGTFTITAQALFNPAGFAGVAPQVNIGGPNSVGVIANADGDVVLNSNMLITTSGKNLLILAKGDIYAKPNVGLNLASKTGPGGSLVAIAGIDVTPPTVGQVLDTINMFVGLGSSLIGGSINLANADVNTYSLADSSGYNGQGGSILLIANAGTKSVGTIHAGGLNSGSAKAHAGDITAYAPGGISVRGDVVTFGALGAGSVSLNAVPVNMTGPLWAQNGYLAPLVSFSPQPSANGSGGAIVITGVVNASSSLAGAGAVTLTAESNVSVGSINATGVSGGNVVLSSLNGAIAVNGSVLTNALNITNTASSANAGDGGTIKISAANDIRVGGNITTTGGTTAGTGDAGNAGYVLVFTSSDDNTIGAFTGNVAIQGFINTAGGSAARSGTAGTGGDVSITAGAIRISGSNNGISVLASGGTGQTGKSTGGSIALTTFAVQAIPSNFNLLSMQKTELAIPGAVFDFGNATVNGVAGAIVSNGTSGLTNTIGTATPSLSGNNVGPVSTVQGNVSVSVVGGPQTITRAGNAVQIAATAGGSRRRITPAEALALYQISRGNTQTIGLNTNGQLLSLDPNGQSSNVTITKDYNLPGSFTSFVIAAADVPSGIALNFAGPFPFINLTNAGLRNLSGSLNFSSSVNAVISAGSIPLTLPQGGNLSSVGKLTLQTSGAAINNSGHISASEIVLLNSSIAPTIIVTNNSTGAINASKLTVSNNYLPTLLTVTNNKGNMSLPIEFELLRLPVAFGSASGVLAAGQSNLIGASTFVFTLSAAGGAQSASLGGTIVVPNLTVIGIPNGTAATGISFESGTELSTTGALTVTTSGAITTGDNAIFKTTGAITLVGGVVQSGRGNTFTAPFITLLTTRGAMSIGNPIGPSTVINAGNGAATIVGLSGLSLVNTVITTKLALNIVSPNGSFASSAGSSYTSILGPITVIGPNGVTFTDSMITAQSLTLIASTAPIFLGNAGLPVSINSTGAINIIGTAGITLNEATIASSAPIIMVAGTSALTDLGSSTVNSSKLINLIGSDVTIGANSNINANQSLTINATKGLINLGTNGGNAFSIAGSSTTLTAVGGITTFAGQVTASVSNITVLGTGSGAFLHSTGTAFGASMGNVFIQTSDITHSGSTTVIAKNGISLLAITGTIALGQSYTTDSGNLLIRTPAALQVNGAALYAGSLAASGLPSSTLASSDVAKIGSIKLFGGSPVFPQGIKVGTGASLTAVGGDLSLIAKGDLELGASNTFSAYGGNLSLLASGAVHGAIGNSFEARAIGSPQPGSSRGGGIEFGAGGTGVSTLPVAQSGLPSAKNASALGSPVLISDNSGTTGVLKTNISNQGSVLLTTSGTHQASLTFNGGAVVFSSNGIPNTVEFDGVTIRVDAYRPIGLFTRTNSTAVEASSNTDDNASVTLAHLIAPGSSGVQLMRGGSAKSVITLIRGRVFLNPVRAIIVKTPIADIELRKGSLVHATLEDDFLRIAACSGPGDTTIVIHGRKIRLAPGEEATLVRGGSSHSPLMDDCVARRNIRKAALSENLTLEVCEFSIASLLANMDHLTCVIRPASAIEKQLSNRLIKVAAVVHQVTAARGVYRASSMPHHYQENNNHYSPVSYK
jgi:fibronectin-binding autotransporter adhesin